MTGPIALETLEHRLGGFKARGDPAGLGVVAVWAGGKRCGGEIREILAGPSSPRA